MQSEHTLDQAEGLRKLLLRPSLRVVTVIGARPGLGATTLVVNLAAALSQRGKQVLVLDENLSGENVANTLSLKPRYDLLHTVRDRLRVREVMLHARGALHVLPAARAMQALPGMHEAECGQLLENLHAASLGMDTVLVDAARDGCSVCAGLHVDEPLLMVLSPTAAGITESYALLKQMAVQHGRTRFDLVVNKVRNAQEGQTIFDNMAALAQRSMQVRLNYLGHIPYDVHLQAMPSSGMAPAGPDTAAAFAGLASRLLHPAAGNGQGGGALQHMMQRLLQHKSAMPRRKAA